MKIKTKIEVTKKDIKGGKRGDGYSCPIALAVRRTLGINIISVDNISVDFPFEGKGFSAEIPTKVQRFIDSFDDGQDVKPFSFILKGEGVY